MLNVLLMNVVLSGLLAWVVMSDLLYRRISNRLVVAVLSLWLGQLTVIALRDGLTDLPALGSGLAASALVLFVGYGLFAVRWIGAGDVKLMAALCLWFSDQAGAFLMVTALAGGVLALGMPILHALERSLALAVMQFAMVIPRVPIRVPRVLQTDAAGTLDGLPYGVAIACGAGLVLWIQ